MYKPRLIGAVEHNRVCHSILYIVSEVGGKTTATAPTGKSFRFVRASMGATDTRFSYSIVISGKEL